VWCGVVDVVMGVVLAKRLGASEFATRFSTVGD
jgi:hypothetical protein